MDTTAMLLKAVIELEKRAAERVYFKLQYTNGNTKAVQGGELFGKVLKEEINQRENGPGLRVEKIFYKKGLEATAKLFKAIIRGDSSSKDMPYLVEVE